MKQVFSIIVLTVLFSFGFSQTPMAQILTKDVPILAASDVLKDLRNETPIKGSMIANEVLIIEFERAIGRPIIFTITPRYLRSVSISTTQEMVRPQTMTFDISHLEPGDYVLDIVAGDAGARAEFTVL